MEYKAIYADEFNDLVFLIGKSMRNGANKSKALGIMESIEGRMTIGSRMPGDARFLDE